MLRVRDCKISIDLLWLWYFYISFFSTNKNQFNMFSSLFLIKKKAILFYIYENQLKKNNQMVNVVRMCAH